MSLRRILLFFAFALALWAGGESMRADDSRQIAEFRARAGNFSSAAISNDGRLLLTGEDDGAVTLWNVSTGANLHNYVGHGSQVAGVALLPDGKRVVTCGDDNRVIIWDLATAKRLVQMSTGDSIPLAMSCTADGALAATGCNDGEIQVWRLSDGEHVTTLRYRSMVCGVQFSPDGKTLAAGYGDGHVVLWDTSDWSAKRTLPDTDAASVGALGFTPDGRMLVTGNQNGAGFVWKLSDGSQVSTFAGYANPEAAPSPPVAPVFAGSVITPEKRGSIVYVCVSPDGGTIFASVQDSPPRFWDLKTGRALGIADWFFPEVGGEPVHFYVARFGYPYATAAVTPRRDFIVTMKENNAQVWRFSFAGYPAGK